MPPTALSACASPPLAAHAAEIMAQQRASKRQNIYCAGRDEDDCDAGAGVGTAFALGGAIVLVYISMFLADSFEEYLQVARLCGAAGYVCVTAMH